MCSYLLAKVGKYYLPVEQKMRKTHTHATLCLYMYIHIIIIIFY